MEYMDTMNPIDTDTLSKDSPSIIILEIAIAYYIVALLFLVYTSKA
jgi:hypothetical protein